MSGVVISNYHMQQRKANIFNYAPFRKTIWKQIRIMHERSRLNKLSNSPTQQQPEKDKDELPLVENAPGLK